MVEDYYIIRNRNCWWVNDYSDISPYLELVACHDDTLKRKDFFISYTIELANCIIEDLGLKDCKATWGKWGARLETDKNKKLSENQLETFAIKITEHPAWLSFKASTAVFTYGKFLI